MIFAGLVIDFLTKYETFNWLMRLYHYDQRVETQDAAQDVYRKKVNTLYPIEIHKKRKKLNLQKYEHVLSRTIMTTLAISNTPMHDTYFYVTFWFIMYKVGFAFFQFFHLVWPTNGILYFFRKKENTDCVTDKDCT